MKLSHSKLGTILSCPMTYYLSYIQGICKKEEKTALWIGSAVHWGIEHDTEDLEQYFIDNGTFKQGNAYTREQMLSEAMVHGYLKHKDEIFDEILTDASTGEKLELLEETHELYVTGKLPCHIGEDKQHDFVGIIDLLLLTNKGFVIIDYKTSTYAPNWNSYLEQIYRYIIMLRSTFPDIPIVKIGIINIRKTSIRQKKSENESQFLNRMKFEYDVNDENYVNYHEYTMDSLDQRRINDYEVNLAKQCDLAALIDSQNIRFINYGAAEGQYGKSDYWDIFYHTPDAYLLYKIRDRIWNEEEQKWVDFRDCVPLDMTVIEQDNVLNKFDTFKKLISAILSNIEDNSFAAAIEILKKDYHTDESLLEVYTKSYFKELEEEYESKREV